MASADFSHSNSHSLLDNTANAKREPGNIARVIGIERLLTKQFFPIHGEHAGNTGPK
jgi:hypothetical protein